MTRSLCSDASEQGRLVRDLRCASLRTSQIYMRSGMKNIRSTESETCHILPTHLGPLLLRSARTIRPLANRSTRPVPSRPLVPHLHTSARSTGLHASIKKRLVAAVGMRLMDRTAAPSHEPAKSHVDLVAHPCHLIGMILTNHATTLVHPWVTMKTPASHHEIDMTLAQRAVALAHQYPVIKQPTRVRVIGTILTPHAVALVHQLETTKKPRDPHEIETTLAPHGTAHAHR
jgi:hypothetical protein